MDARSKKRRDASRRLAKTFVGEFTSRFSAEFILNDATVNLGRRETSEAYFGDVMNLSENYGAVKCRQFNVPPSRLLRVSRFVFDDSITGLFI